MSKVSSRRMQGLIDWEEAISTFRWPVAKGYFIYGGKIVPDRSAGWWKVTASAPLTDRNLFLTFARRLGGRGDDLPDSAILRWVRKHGLLRLKNPDGDTLSFDNYAPLKPEEFREEARRAYESLTLFEALEAKNPDAIRPRIDRKRIDPPGQPGEGTLADLYVDGQPIPMVSSAGGDLPDQDVLLAAQVALEWFVKSRLTGVSPSFDHFSGDPRPSGLHRPRLILKVPDLLTAVWFQFAILISDTRPRKYCVICGDVIPGKRSDRETCSARCRKAKSRRDNVQE